MFCRRLEHSSPSISLSFPESFSARFSPAPAGGDLKLEGFPRRGEHAALYPGRLPDGLRRGAGGRLRGRRRRLRRLGLRRYSMDRAMVHVDRRRSDRQVARSEKILGGSVMWLHKAIVLVLFTTSGPPGRRRMKPSPSAVVCSPKMAAMAPAIKSIPRTACAHPLYPARSQGEGFARFAPAGGEMRVEPEHADRS